MRDFKIRTSEWCLLGGAIAFLVGYLVSTRALDHHLRECVSVTHQMSPTAIDTVRETNSIPDPHPAVTGL